MDNPDKPDSNSPPEEESPVTGLSDLAHEELDEKPAAEPAVPLPSDMPAFGQPESAPKEKEAEWEPPPMTVTFWQKLAPKSRFRPIHFILGGLLVVVAGGGVAAVLYLRQPPRADEPGEKIAAATKTDAPSESQPAATPKPAAADAAAPATPTPAETADAGETKTTKPRARARDKRRTSPPPSPKETKKDEPVAAPAPPAPAPEPEPAAAEAGGEPLTANDIKLGVKQNMAKVKGCIKSARNEGVLEPGRHTLILDWKITPSGAVTDAHLRGPSHVVNTSLARCFSSAMRRWKFRASPKGAPVKNFPFGPFNLK